MGTAQFRGAYGGACRRWGAQDATVRSWPTSLKSPSPPAGRLLEISRCVVQDVGVTTKCDGMCTGGLYPLEQAGPWGQKAWANGNSEYLGRVPTPLESSLSVHLAELLGFAGFRPISDVARRSPRR